MPMLSRFDDQALDQWLRNCLRARHAALLDEPIPESLLRLLRDDPQP